MRESELERKVVELCKARGLLCYKFSSPAHRGVPDRIILGRGKAVFLELKAPGHTPTELQKRELKKLQEAGFYAFWSSDIHSITRVLNTLFPV